MTAAAAASPFAARRRSRARNEVLQPHQGRPRRPSETLQGRTSQMCGGFHWNAAMQSSHLIAPFLNQCQRRLQVEQGVTFQLSLHQYQTASGC